MLLISSWKMPQKCVNVLQKQPSEKLRGAVIGRQHSVKNPSRTLQKRQREPEPDSTWSCSGLCTGLRWGEAETLAAKAPPGYLLGKRDPGGSGTERQAQLARPELGARHVLGSCLQWGT